MLAVARSTYDGSRLNDNMNADVLLKAPVCIYSACICTYACTPNLHMHACMRHNVLKHSCIGVTNALTHAYPLTGSVSYDDRTSSYPGSTPRGRHPSLRHRQEGWCVCLRVCRNEKERDRWYVTAPCSPPITASFY